MQAPDTTLTQKIALLVAGVPILANLLFAFGAYDVSPEQVKALQDTLTWGGVFAGALVLGDAGIRHGRSRALAPTVQNITAVAEGAPPEPGTVHDASDTRVDEPEPGDEPTTPPGVAPE